MKWLLIYYLLIHNIKKKLLVRISYILTFFTDVDAACISGLFYSSKAYCILHSNENCIQVADKGINFHLNIFSGQYVKYFEYLLSTETYSISFNLICILTTELDGFVVNLIVY